MHEMTLGLAAKCLAGGEPAFEAVTVVAEEIENYLVVPGTGLFYSSIQQLAKQALTHGFRPEEIEAEAIAQFRKIQAAGITISHFDAHKHAHIFPSILKPLLRAAAVCGVPALRNPFEPVFSMPIPSLLRIPVRYAG